MSDVIFLRTAPHRDFRSRLETTALWFSQYAFWSPVATKYLRARWKSSEWSEQNASTLAAKSESQQRSVELKDISVQRQRNKLIILCVGGSCFQCQLVR